MNKKIAVFSLLFFTLLLVSCSTVTKEVSISIVVDPTVVSDAEFVYDTTIAIDERANAGACFTKLLDTLEISHEGFSEGYVTKIDAFALEGNLSWIFYINGALSDVGVDDYIPKDGDCVSLVYTDWTKVFDLGE